MTPEIVEKVARLLASYRDGDDYDWRDYTPDAKAAIEATLQALRDADIPIEAWVAAKTTGREDMARTVKAVIDSALQSLRSS